MRSIRVLLWILVSGLALVSPIVAQGDEEDGLSDREARLLYKEFQEIRSFGIIAVSLVGDAVRIGLDEKRLTKYTKEKFKNYFIGVPFEDISKDSKKFFDLLSSREANIGNITFRVWVIGDDYPIVYHIRCDAGNFNNPSIWNEEILGHASKKTVPDSIEKFIDEMLQAFSKTYFRIKKREK